VHLSLEIQTAKNVGSRYGKPVVLKIASGKMYKQKYKFYKSENGVWLTEAVPVEYITY
jgi:putative RNA 2'-phosphotransferase